MQTFALLTLLASNAAAFPHLTPGGMDRFAAALGKRQAAAPQGAGALPLVPPPFDAKSQYVSNKGAHAFVAPGVGDARGECPGLNALANHNYLPHNGYATIAQFINATITGFGMGPDLAAFLAVFGAVVDGDLKGWSIGGGPHVGIGGSHGNYEADSSPIRGDLYQYGSNVDLQISQFKELYNMQPDAATANYNLEVLRTFRGKRLQESIDKNPYFSYQPFSGNIVTQAAFTFIYRFMSNKSAEYPEGRLDKATLKSFMSITGDDNNLKWTPGHEKFPDNFYKRNDADQYTIPYFQTDILYIAETVPGALLIGCNTGKVDTYQTISANELSNGAYTAQQALANPLCFGTAFALAELPGLTGLSLGALAPLTSAINTATKGLNCKAIGSVNQTAVAACPGFSFYGGPKAALAPGAIQG